MVQGQSQHIAQGAQVNGQTQAQQLQMSQGAQQQDSQQLQQDFE